MPKWENYTGCMINVGGGEMVPSVKCLEVIFIRILTITLTLATLALFVMLLIGGFKYMTSAGDPKAATSAKQTITMAFAGIILMAVAYLIFLIIKNFTGVDILRFEIPVTPIP